MSVNIYTHAFSPNLLAWLKRIKMRLYHIIAINERSGKKVYCTSEPMPHKEACIVLSKFSYHPARRLQLEEVTL